MNNGISALETWIQGVVLNRSERRSDTRCRIVEFLYRENSPEEQFYIGHSQQYMTGYQFYRGRFSHECHASVFFASSRHDISRTGV